jgi:hypothetical protein
MIGITLAARWSARSTISARALWRASSIFGLPTVTPRALAAAKSTYLEFSTYANTPIELAPRSKLGRARRGWALGLKPSRDGGVRTAERAPDYRWNIPRLRRVREPPHLSSGRSWPALSPIFVKGQFFGCVFVRPLRVGTNNWGPPWDSFIKRGSPPECRGPLGGTRPPIWPARDRRSQAPDPRRKSARHRSNARSRPGSGRRHSADARTAPVHRLPCRSCRSSCSQHVLPPHFSTCWRQTAGLRCQAIDIISSRSAPHISGKHMGSSEQI